MNKLWGYEDYVKHLAHPNRLVRLRALDALTVHYPYRYADEVSKLISDEDEHLASGALHYLAEHHTVMHAPAILDCFKIDARSIVASNCAIALGRLRYEPALDIILEKFVATKNADVFLGIAAYLGEIRRTECRDALKAAFLQLPDTILQEAAAGYLLCHHQPEDLFFVLDGYLGPETRLQGSKEIFRVLAHALGGSEYYRELTEFKENNILKNPKKVIDLVIERNLACKPDGAVLADMAKTLKKEAYQSYADAVLTDARRIIQARYPQTPCPAWLSEMYGQDAMGLALLEALSKDSSWKRIRQMQGWTRSLASLIVSAYFAIIERDAYIPALSPQADDKTVMDALMNCGQDLPEPVQKKIQKSAPISELKAMLSEDLLPWRDIWTVRLMGRIGSKEFVPDLIRVLQKVDDMDYIYSDAIRAIHALEESAGEMIISAINNNELNDWEVFGVIEYLPYSAVYDIALQRWNNGSGKMDSYEMFAGTLERIGDPRGIEKLQEIYASENDATYIGDALECLSAIHNMNIPEMADIYQKRKEREERRKDRLEELDAFAEKYGLETKKKTPKIGRNQPCPCGSGKKYKKCCLNKISLS